MFTPMNLLTFQAIQKANSPKPKTVKATDPITGQVSLVNIKTLEITEDNTMEPQWFIGEPEHQGWYFVTAKPKEWQFAVPVRVRKIDDGCNAVEFELFWKSQWESTKNWQKALWYGPLPKLTFPGKLAEAPGVGSFERRGSP